MTEKMKNFSKIKRECMCDHVSKLPYFSEVSTDFD